MWHWGVSCVWSIYVDVTDVLLNCGLLKDMIPVWFVFISFTVYNTSTVHVIDSHSVDWISMLTSKHANKWIKEIEVINSQFLKNLWNIILIDIVNCIYCNQYYLLQPSTILSKTCTKCCRIYHVNKDTVLALSDLSCRDP